MADRKTATLVRRIAEMVSQSIIHVEREQSRQAGCRMDRQEQAIQKESNRKIIQPSSLSGAHKHTQVRTNTI